MTQSFNTILSGGPGVASTAPIGSIILDAIGAQAGHLLCDGTAFDGTTYPDLAAYLGGTTLPTLADHASGAVYMIKAADSVRDVAMLETQDIDRRVGENATAIQDNTTVETVNVANLVGDSAAVTFTKSGNVVTAHWSVASARTVPNSTAVVNIPIGYRPHASLNGMEFPSSTNESTASLNNCRWIFNVVDDTLFSWSWQTTSLAPRFHATWITRD